jgi:hypothetical protein
VKMRVLAVALALVSALALLAFVAPARASTALPTWSIGDYWVYNLTGFSPFTGANSGTWRMDTVGTDSITIGGTTFSAYHLKDNISVTITSGSTTTTITEYGDSWYRTSDLALAKQTRGLSLGGLVENITTTNSPPPGYQWPLTAGATWSQNYQIKEVIVLGSMTSTTYLNVTGSVTVQSDTNVTVAAGSFSTTPVEQSGAGSTNTSYWSATAGNVVESESQSPSPYGPTSEVLQLKSFNHQANAGGVSGLFLGLLLWEWIGLILVVVVIVAVAVLLVRRRPGMPQPAPPGTEPPTGPTPLGQQPPGPPSGPPPQAPGPPTG